MRTQLVVLLSIALSIPALAAKPKSPGKSSDQTTSRTDTARSAVANDEVVPVRPAKKKTRVHHTFPPAAKRM